MKTYTTKQIAREWNIFLGEYANSPNFKDYDDFEKSDYCNTKWVHVDDVIDLLNNLDLNVYDEYTIMHISNTILSQSNEVKKE